MSNKQQKQGQDNTGKCKIESFFKNRCGGPKHPKGRDCKENQGYSKEDAKPKQGMPRMHFVDVIHAFKEYGQLLFGITG